MGIVLNQPTTICLPELLSQLGIVCNHDNLKQHPVYAGGPVQTEHGFVLHDDGADFDGSIKINDQLRLTSSDGILHSLANGHRPDNFRVALGYAGWAPGQLENEIQANAWLIINYYQELVFDTPAEKQWLMAGNLLGIDLNLLICGAGHA